MRLSGSETAARWMLLPGVLFFLAPVVRIKQFANKGFRLLFLAWVLLLPVLCGGIKNGGAIAAILAAGIWHATTPTRTRTPRFNTTLLLLCLFTAAPLTCAPLTCALLPIQLPEIWGCPGVWPALAALPLWLKIGAELLTADFTPPAATRLPRKAATLDVVLPCYNPGGAWVERMVETHRRFESRLEGCSVRFIVVNDGSKRGFTPEAQRQLRESLPGILIVDNAVNRGKGAAVRDGLKVSTSELALYTDYDFPYDVDAMCRAVRLLEEGYDVVIATRNRTYYSRLSARRKVMSFASRILNHLVLGLTHTDTQGGLKGFDRRGKSYLASTRTPRFLFDTEFIYHASQHADVSICEMPADLREGVLLPDMRRGVLAEELKNLFLIALRG